MIDIKLLRDEKTRELVIQSEKKRFKDPERVNIAYRLDRKKIEIMFKKENIQKRINELLKMIKMYYKKNKELNDSNCKDKLNGKMEDIDLKEGVVDNKMKLNNFNNTENDINSLKEELDQLKCQRIELENELKELNNQFNEIFKSIGNILDDNVPVSENEEDAVVRKEWKCNRELLTKLPFYEIMERMGCIDMKRGSKISGHRGYFILEELALLENGLVRYSIDFLRKKGFLLIQVPLMINKEIMKKTVQLSDFQEQLYEIEENNYLIATSEQSISTMYMNERITDNELPIKYCGQSICFRKEAGAAGKDNKGIFRVHQFEKIEQFIICKPEDSKNYHEEMIKISEEFMESLNISYRTIIITSKELNDAASIKYDLEGYFPFNDNYRELVSASNCTDYQSRDLEVRYGINKDNGNKVYVHMLNSTLCAVQRALCCIVENYQHGEGVIVPKVLRTYVGIDYITFKK